MTNCELTTRSSGNIGIMDRAIRVGIGLAASIAFLYASIEGNDAYPLFKLMAAALVLTGIAGWDPLYAAYRSVTERRGKKGDYGNSSFNAA